MDDREGGARRVPAWLRTVGIGAWLLIGVAGAIAGAALIVVVARSVVLPLIVAAVLAVVFIPMVDAFERRRMPRWAGVLIVVLLVMGLAAAVAMIVIVGVAAQSDEIARQLGAAVAKVGSVAAQAGVSAAALDQVKKTVAGASPSLVGGLFSSLTGWISSAVQVALGVFVAFNILFFLLKDGPVIQHRLVGWLPVSVPVGEQVLTRAATSIRRYFLGASILGLLNIAVIGPAALALRLPLVGAIVIVNFLGTYVPYLGAVLAGAFTVLVALGAGGLSAAVWMLVVVIFANGVLQTLVQPFAFSAVLALHPLVVLLVTLLGGVFGGIIGITLATPLTAVAVDLVRILRAPVEGAAPATTPSRAGDDYSATLWPGSHYQG